MDLFEQRTLAEGLRAIEGESPNLSISSSYTEQDTFESRLLQRVALLDSKLKLSSVLVRFKAVSRNLFILLSFIFAIIGASTVAKLFFTEQGTQINFFWAFALFFIPNLFTLLLWLFFFSRATLLTNGWLAHFIQFLLLQFEKRFNSQGYEETSRLSLLKCYLTHFFSGELGRYQLSTLTHLLWFSYFSGATLMLVLMLATHQVDFIWQTSLLSQQSFQWLTEFLAFLPQLLGISVPDALQIAQSNLAHFDSIIDPEQSRFAWSSLLISSLLLYGVIPRLLLCLLMQFLLKGKKRYFSLDFSLPYYVQLRQQLKPNVTSLGIVDADNKTQAEEVPQYKAKSGYALPNQFYPIAIELSDKQFEICQKHVGSKYTEVLRNICDFDGQLAIEKKLPDIEIADIILYIAINRVADRGLLNFIHSLIHLSGKSFYLLLVDDGVGDKVLVKNRFNDWYSAAHKLAIPLDNIVHLCADGVKENE